jgi:CheY-like chemotaxis protein
MSYATILLADDEPDIHTLLTPMLEREGYAVTHARTGPEAVTLARQGAQQPVAGGVAVPVARRAPPAERKNPVQQAWNFSRGPVAHRSQVGDQANVPEQG